MEEGKEEIEAFPYILIFSGVSLAMSLIQKGSINGGDLWGSILFGTVAGFGFKFIREKQQKGKDEKK